MEVETPVAETHALQPESHALNGTSVQRPNLQLSPSNPDPEPQTFDDRVDAPFHQLPDHLAFGRLDAARFSACRNWLVLIGPRYDYSTAPATCLITLRVTRPESYVTWSSHHFAFALNSFSRDFSSYFFDIAGTLALSWYGTWLISGQEGEERKERCCTDHACAGAGKISG